VPIIAPPLLAESRDGLSFGPFGYKLELRGETGLIPLRDYRRSGSIPYVTFALIIINALVYLYQVMLQGQPSEFGQNISQADIFIYRYGLVPRELTHLQDLPPLIPFAPRFIWITLFTSMFLHGGLLHIAGNMLYLWIFGDNIEDAMGHLKFLVFYLLCGAIAALSQVMISINGTNPIIGASGAIAGVLGAYLMLFPYSRILTVVIFFFFIRFIEIPAMIILGFWFVYQLLLAPSGLSSGGGVAFFAHIGGFIAGALLVYLFKKRHVEVQLFRPRYF
jgi:membrane associated rhomboid family serine protease